MHYFRHVLDDYKVAEGLYPSDTDIPTITSMLQLSQVAVQIDTTTLAGQAVGRIHEVSIQLLENQFHSQVSPTSDLDVLLKVLEQQMA
jgi:hypothetical protein